MKEFIISHQEEGQRFDKYLVKCLPKAQKSFLYKMLRKKNIVLNGKKADGNEKIKAGDSVKIFFSDETFEKFSDEKTSVKIAAVSDEVKLEVLYEDDKFLIVNKPSGMLSQKAEKNDISLVEYVNDYLAAKEEHKESTFKAGICNRLDRNTSGIVVAGKSVVGLQEMSAAFHDRTIKKYYICIVKGRVSKRVHIKGWLRKDADVNKVNVVKNIPQGAGMDDYTAIETEYFPVCISDEVSLVKVHLITGKTHQIRAHLAYEKHPLAGDAKYGDKTFNRYFKEKYGIKNQMLHAYELAIPKAISSNMNIDNAADKDNAYINDTGEMCIRTNVPDGFIKVLKGENLWQHGTQEDLEALH